MAILKCPKCGGSGEIVYYPPYNSTSAAPTKTVCPSCNGKGYVTDNPEGGK